MQKDQHRREIEQAIETYLLGLQSGDLEAIAFDRRVRFEGVLLEGALEGDSNLREFLAGLSENIASIHTRRVVIDGNHACAMFTWRTTSGIEIDMCDQFQFRKGRIVYLRPYFDPRPLFRD